MLGHHLVQSRDLLVERGDDADLSEDDSRVGLLKGRWLTQRRGSQHRQQGLGLGLDVVAASSPQCGNQLPASQFRGLVRVRRSPHHRQSIRCR